MTLPADNQFLRPKVTGRIAFSAAVGARELTPVNPTLYHRFLTGGS
jgi:hypothetical protein